MRFKVGDRVVSVLECGARERGGRAVVTRVDEDVLVHVKFDGEEETGGWYEYRFKLEEMHPEWGEMAP